MVALAGTIIWAVCRASIGSSRPARRSVPVDSPQLFEVLNGVASSTEQTMPADVYLVNDVNAFVTQRGGVMGFGSRRVMGIGLPLMQALTVQELKAVLAHEFGHYHAGDVSIGPWIYKTRAAIGRTIHQLGEGSLQKIFIAYGNLFLRVTHAVSRRQEFIADEVAAQRRRRGGDGVGAAQGARRRGRVSQLLARRSQPGAQLRLPAAARRRLREVRPGRVGQLEHGDRYSDGGSRRRVEPLRHAPAAARARRRAEGLATGAWGDTRPAVSLLGDPQRWERRLLATAINEEWARSLKPVGWDKVVDTVYVPMWRQGVKENARVLAGITLTRLHSPGGFATSGMFRDGDQALLHQIHVVNMALSLALLDAGWTVSTSPGEEVVFRRDAHEMRPFAELMGVAMGKVTPEQWTARCVELGIDGVVLGGPARV